MFNQEEALKRQHRVPQYNALVVAHSDRERVIVALPWRLRLNLGEFDVIYA